MLLNVIVSNTVWQYLVLLNRMMVLIENDAVEPLSDKNEAEYNKLQEDSDRHRLWYTFSQADKDFINSVESRKGK